MFEIQGKNELPPSLAPEIPRTAVGEGTGEENAFRVENIVGVELHPPGGIGEAAEAVTAHQAGQDVTVGLVLLVAIQADAAPRVELVGETNNRGAAVAE